MQIQSQSIPRKHFLSWLFATIGAFFLFSFFKKNDKSKHEKDITLSLRSKADSRACSYSPPSYYS